MCIYVYVRLYETNYIHKRRQSSDIKEWLQVQVQSEVVLFQGSISRSGLDYAVDYSL